MKCDDNLGKSQNVTIIVQPQTITNLYRLDDFGIDGCSGCTGLGWNQALWASCGSFCIVLSDRQINFHPGWRCEHPQKKTRVPSNVLHWKTKQLYKVLQVAKPQSPRIGCHQVTSLPVAAWKLPVKVWPNFTQCFCWAPDQMNPQKGKYKYLISDRQQATKQWPESFNTETGGYKKLTYLGYQKQSLTITEQESYKNGERSHQSSATWKHGKTV